MEREHLDRLMQAGRAVHAAADAVDHAVAEILGLTRNDLRCLNLLEFGPLAPGEIGRRLALTSGAVTALLDRLERHGFVERVRAPTDRRSVHVQIPAAQFQRVGSLYREVAAAMAERFAPLGAAEADAAAAALQAFAEALQAGLSRLTARAGETP